jgi:hypothetical protein
MTFAEFKATFKSSDPPPVGPALVALWHAGKDQWTRAHEIAQDIDDETGAWVHAYLHRVEGDTANAAYWYRRAGRAVAREALDVEFEQIVTELLND